VNLAALHRVSLRRMLIVLLLAGVMVGSLVQVALTWQTARAAVNAAFDRSLYGAVKAIDANVSTESGGLAVELPYVLFEFFELTANGPVHYRVATLDGLVEIGSPDLPMPAQPLAERQPHFDTVDYAGAQVRIATYQRTLAQPVGGSSDTRLVIQVAEPFASRDQFGQRFLMGAIARDALLAALAAAAVAAAVAWALRPLRQLRQEVAARAPDDLSPMDTSRVPRDVLPLVEAMNQHILRNRELQEHQRRFVDDASHQLRTPLSTLQTQLAFAQRANDLPSVQAALTALREQLRHTIRQTNQMLALARADSCDLDTEVVDLSEIAQEVTRRWWPQARAQGIDLGLETPQLPAWVQVQRELLDEALANLLDNALRYTPAGGRITVEVAVTGDSVHLGVRDSGPGIPPEELPRAMQRFFRASNAQGAGSGLGLAIVASIAQRHQGVFTLQQAPEEGGLWARLVLPRAPRAPVADRTP